MPERELDAYLAEHLFGWHRWETFRDQARKMPVTEWIREGGITSRLPAYSSTGDGMVIVLEAMRGRGFEFSLRLSEDSSQWMAIIIFGPPIGSAICRSDTLPRAVALAAKAALEAARPTPVDGGQT